MIAFSPDQVGAGRIVIAFLAFIPLFIKNFKRVDWTAIKPLLVVGVCGSALPAFLFATAQTHISSAVAGVLNSLTPIFTFILAILIFKHAFKWSQLIGVLLGFGGVLIISLSKSEGQEHFAFFYATLIIVATVSYALSANTIKNFLNTMNPILISTVSFMLVGPFVLVYLINTTFLETVSNHPAGHSSLLALVVLSLLGTFGANILFFRLVQLTDAVFSSSVSFVIPFVALFWGFLDGEHLGIFHFLALILIISGVVLIKFKK